MTSILRSVPLDWRLVALTAALFALARLAPSEADPTGVATGAAITGGTSSSGVHVTTRLDRTRILAADGVVRMEITVTGDARSRSIARVPTDVVVVLDKSGSMAGDKIRYARDAASALVELLGPDDRFGLITYDDEARYAVRTGFATGGAVEGWKRAIASVGARGSTNMSAGLDLALDELDALKTAGRASRVILISDGLPNRGDASQQGLVRRADRAARSEFVLTSVGVGADFNENLMGTLADAGTGNYYYLQNGNSLGEVFAEEFSSARQTIASGIVVTIDLPAGMTLREAGGFPIRQGGGHASFNMGPLLAGQERKLWLSFAAEGGRSAYELGTLDLEWSDSSGRQSLRGGQKQSLAVVAERQDWLGGLDKEAYEQAQVTESYNKMRQDVSRAVQAGKADEARRSLADYKQKTQVDFDDLGGELLQGNLEEVEQLEAEVDAAFSGAAPEQEEKRNSLSKRESAAAWKARKQ